MHIRMLATAAAVAFSAAAIAESAHEWSGTASIGANYTSGNTEKEDLTAALTVNHQYGKWGNTFDAYAFSAKDDDTRSAEKYRLALQTRYDINDKSYLFGQLEYLDDRFGGYDYQMSELLGYGYRFFDADPDVIIAGDELSLFAEASVGARQSETLAGVEEEDFIQRLRGRADWVVNDHVTLIEDAYYTFGDAYDEARSYTGAKVKLSDQLYLAIGFTVDWKSDVPAGVEDTDTITTISLGYDF